MKEFDLEAAKAGAPVQTRDGRPVRIICFDFKDELYPIIGLVYDNRGEYVASYTNEGDYLITDDDENGNYQDLFMVSNTKIGWINVYKKDSTNRQEISPCVYESKEEALKYASKSCIDTIQIEWEE